MNDEELFSPASCCCHCIHVTGTSETQEKVLCGKHHIEIADYMICHFFRFNKKNEHLINALKREIEETHIRYKNMER